MPFKRLQPHGLKVRAPATSRAPVFACAALVFLILAACFWNTAQAQNRLLGIAVLKDTTDIVDLSPYALIQPDPDGKVSPQSITQSKGQILTGKMSTGDMINLGHTGESFWLTMRINNNATKDRWVVDMGRRSQGRLGYIESAKAYEMTATADTFKLEEVKPIDNKGVFVFTIPKGTQKYILLNITPAAGRPAVLPLKLYSEEAFIKHTQQKLNPHGIHSFFLLLYAIFFLSTAFVRQEYKLFVFSAFFVYELGIWTATENIGAIIGFDMFDLMISGMMLGFSLFSIWMAKIFLDVEYGSFTERHVLYGLAWLNILASILAYLLPVSDGLTQICLLYGAPAITLSAICFMAFAHSAQLDIARRYYAMGTVFPVIGLAIVFLELLQILPHDAVLINTLWYSVSVQGFFMVIATQKKLDIQTPLAAVAANKRVAVAAAQPAPSYPDGLDFSGMKDAKEKGDHNRLLKVIEKERELLAEFRAKENDRVSEMRKAKEDADEANRAKSAFLAVVSHEIRTPMTGVMGMVRLLLDSSITKQQRDYVLTIQESSEAMMALLNDILDFEKIQHGRIELEDISFDLHRMVQGVITLMSGHAAEKGIALSARVDDDLPKFVKGDPTRLRQVLLNLMGNAIKFTQRGSVTLLVKTLENQSPQKDPDKHLIYFAIQDTGIGISGEAKKNLFTPFAQANSTISRKFGGTGLGLAISKGLIETMGSTININSKEGEGSTFFFTLKMGQGLVSGNEKPLPKHEETATVRHTQPLKILVVDDNSITRKVIVSFLDKGHHDIQTASDAEEGLSKIYRDAFDLVFMDVELPGMKGNEATRILREHRDPVKSQVPVIAVTGNVAREDMEQYLADGMTGFLPKPIDLEKLQSIVEEIAHDSYEREIRMPESADPFTFTEEDFAKIAAKAEEMPTDKNIFNPDMLQSLKDTIGAAQLDELLNELIVKTDEILAAMGEASKNNDLSTLAARAHELKGMAGNFGLVEISSLAALAERKAKSADTVELNMLVSSLPDASLRAQSALKDWTSY